ncbi:hypothetical protein L2E82_22099 [Cichorium intybus]|uniref:Uncharacterized protein n=1 Tax=Cichorium intybus TaxID=13427 RepID=A0ACB9DWY5_CICIN|nr:hypothetical protein L2E82_22099 [Cichorium intybus]
MGTALFSFPTIWRHRFLRFRRIHVLISPLYLTIIVLFPKPVRAIDIRTKSVLKEISQPSSEPKMTENMWVRSDVRTSRWAHAQATELEKQVEYLKNEIAKQKTKKDALEARINVTETKISELNQKLEKLEKTNEEQNIRIRNTERALKKAEEERIKVQLKVARYSKEPTDFHESWLPPWLAVHLL